MSLKLLVMIFCLIGAEKAFAMQLLIINKNNYEYHADKVTKAKNLFESIHTEFNFPAGLLASKFDADVEQLKNNQSRLAVVLQDEKMIGSVFLVYNKNLSMMQARWLGYDESLEQQNVIDAVKVIVAAVIKETEHLCCCSSKVVQKKYGWLIKASGLIEDPRCFIFDLQADPQSPFTADKYDWFSTVFTQEDSNLEEVD